MDDGWTGLAGLLAARESLHAWARAEPRVVAAVAFGSTEREGGGADEWSDLDLAFVVEDAASWRADLEWVDEIGAVWTRLLIDGPVPGMPVVQVVLAGGFDLDLIPLDRAGLEVLREPELAAAFFGAGTRVVVDRAGLFDGVPMQGTALPIAPPTAASFEHTVMVFLHQTVWATKRLRRGELWRAHDDLDDFMRDRMLTLLEWHALVRGSVGVSAESRKLERWIPDDVAAVLPATFAGYDAGSLASGLIRSLELVGWVGREVAAAHGFRYPDAAHEAIAAWTRARLAEAGLSVLARRISRRDA